MPEFNAEAPQATVSEGFAQGSYVAARAGIEPMTLRTKGVDSTNAPPCPITIIKDGWVDGWMDGRTDGRTDRQTDRQRRGRERD